MNQYRIKIFMAIVVVFAHTRPLENCSNPIIQTIYSQVAHLSYPFFFLSSGYLLSAKLSSFSDVSQKISITAKSLFKTAKLYSFWSIVYLPLALYAYWRDKTPFMYSVADYIRGFLFIGEHYNSWHLWYLLSTVYALILVIILLRLQLNPKKWTIVVGFVSLLSIFMTEISGNQEALPPLLHIIRLLISNTTSGGRILQGCIFIPVGILMADKNLSIQKWVVLFAGSFLANIFIDNAVVSKLLLISAGISFFGIAIQINLKNHSIYVICRKLSTDVYLIHMYVWSFYCSLVYRAVHFGWDSFVVTAIVSLAVGLLHQHLDKKKKLLRK